MEPTAEELVKHPAIIAAASDLQAMAVAAFGSGFLRGEMSPFTWEDACHAHLYLYVNPGIATRPKRHETLMQMLNWLALHPNEVVSRWMVCSFR